MKSSSNLDFNIRLVLVVARFSYFSSSEEEGFETELTLDYFLESSSDEDEPEELEDEPEEDEPLPLEESDEPLSDELSEEFTSGKISFYRSPSSLRS